MAISLLVKIFLVYQGVFFLIVASALGAEAIRLDLEQAIKMAFEQNLELKAKREELGIAEGRGSSLIFFSNRIPSWKVMWGILAYKGEPEFAKNQTNFGFSLYQEFEIGGQPRYRREAAQGNLEKVKFEIGDFERTLRFRITESF